MARDDFTVDMASSIKIPRISAVAKYEVLIEPILPLQNPSASRAQITTTTTVGESTTYYNRQDEVPHRSPLPPRNIGVPYSRRHSRLGARGPFLLIKSRPSSGVTTPTRTSPSPSWRGKSKGHTGRGLGPRDGGSDSDKRATLQRCSSRPGGQILTCLCSCTVT